MNVAEEAQKSQPSVKQGFIRKALKALSSSMKKGSTPEQIQQYIALIQQLDEPVPVEAFRLELENLRNDLNAVLTKLDMI